MEILNTLRPCSSHYAHAAHIEPMQLQTLKGLNGPCIPIFRTQFTACAVFLRYGVRYGMVRYGVRTAAEKLKVSAGSIAWRHSWEKWKEEPKKNIMGGIYALSRGGWGG